MMMIEKQIEKESLEPMNLRCWDCTLNVTFMTRERRVGLRDLELVVGPVCAVVEPSAQGWGAALLGRLYYTRPRFIKNN